MRRTLLLIVVITVVIWSAWAAPFLYGVEAGPCDEQGFIVSNQTMLNLWYTRNGGDCTIWIHGHVMRLDPADTVVIFSDMSCEERYCSEITYKNLKPFDVNEDCGVRILPQCNISDM